jgi:hypothetical protein
MTWAICIGRAIASVAVCAMGSYCMYITEGETGIGWAILGLLVLWGSSAIEFGHKPEEETP